MKIRCVMTGLSVCAVLFCSADTRLNINMAGAGTNALLTWQSELDWRYSLEHSEHLFSNAWKPIADRVVGTGAMLSVSNGVDGTSGFWRLLEDEGPLTAFMWNLWTEQPVVPGRIKDVGANTIWLHGNEAWFPEHAETLETNNLACMPNYKVLNDYDWTNRVPEYRPRFFLSSDPVTASGSSLAIDLLAGYESNYQIEEDSFYRPYWKVWDRTEQTVVSSGDWNYSDGTLILSSAQAGHEYNTAFSATDLESAITLDMFSTNAQQLILDQYQSIMDQDVSSLFRPTQFAFHFYGHDMPTGTFHDWYGPGVILSRFFIERYEHKYDKPFDLETMYENGELHSTNDEYDEGYRGVLEVQREAAQDFAVRFTDGFHRRGREVRMFWGDSWVGLEPQAADFADKGFDQIVTAMSVPQDVRRIMTIDDSVRRSLRFGFWDVSVGEGVPTFFTDWKSFLRAALRTFPEGMNVGGPSVLNLMNNEAGFEEYVQERYAEFEFLYDEIHGAQAYTNGMVVGVLNSWGTARAWPREWTVNESQAFWRALADLPVEVMALSFADVESGGIPGEVDVLLNIGEPGSAWAGGDEWTAPVVSAVERFVSDGGGFIGTDGCGVTSGTYPLENLLGITFVQLASDRAKAGIFNKKDKYRRYLAQDPAAVYKSMNLAASTASMLDLSNALGSILFNTEMNTLPSPGPERMDDNGSAGAILTRRLLGAGQAWYASGIPEDKTGRDFLKRLVYEAAGQAELRKQLDCETIGGFVYWYPDRQVLLAYNQEAEFSSLMIHLEALTGGGVEQCTALTTNVSDFVLSGSSVSVSVPQGEFAAWRTSSTSEVMMAGQVDGNAGSRCVEGMPLLACVQVPDGQRKLTDTGKE